MKGAAVFLDRDGVLNEAVIREGRPYPPASLEDLKLAPGAEKACAQFKAAHLTLICVTNQPDIARGKADPGAVNAINDRLMDVMGLDAIKVCPHDDSDQCHCRKPKAGLILDAAATFDIDLGLSVMVGDRWRDIEAGVNAGIATVFIDHNYAERRPEKADLTVHSLAEAVPWILERLTAFHPKEFI